jgi:hypothetical protein
MYQMTASFIEMYRQQMSGLHHFTTASISGIERAQQTALDATRQVVDQQLNIVGRVADQASQAVLDPDQVRPAVEGMMRAQRDMAQALTDTQRRCVEALSTQNGDQQQQAPFTQYADAMQQTIQQWQRFTEQLFNVAREQTEQMTRDAQRQQSELAHSTARSADETAKRFESAATSGASAAATSASSGRKPEVGRTGSSQSSRSTAEQA